MNEAHVLAGSWLSCCGNIDSCFGVKDVFWRWRHYKCSLTAFQFNQTRCANLQVQRQSTGWHIDLGSYVSFLSSARCQDWLCMTAVITGTLSWCFLLKHTATQLAEYSEAKPLITMTTEGKKKNSSNKHISLTLTKTHDSYKSAVCLQSWLIKKKNKKKRYYSAFKDIKCIFVSPKNKPHANTQKTQG